MKIEAEALKYKAEQEAEATRVKGLAEAEAIKAKALSEAEGIDKKAEAMQKMQEAAILEMYFKVLPDVAKNIAAPLQNIDKITMYGSGNTSQMVEDITKSLTQINSGLGDSLGFDIKSILLGAFGGRLGAMMDKPAIEGQVATQDQTASGTENTEKPVDSVVETTGSKVVKKDTGNKKK